MRPPWWRARAGLLLALLGSACTFDEKLVAVQEPSVVVHAVLNPGAEETEILVERSLSGEVNIVKDQRYDPNDPIRSGGGVPVSGADVSVTGPDGVLTARETMVRTALGVVGTGRYLLVSPGGLLLSPRIVPGARYTLRIRTPEGTVVTGSTVVPNARPFELSSRLDPFNRDRDSLRLAWRDVVGARSYTLRVESPFGPFLLFSDSTRLTLPGDLRNFFASSLQRAFIPGFRQRVSLAAVDTNFYDYYRSRNDPFTGSGIINRLEGGIGLFGAAVSLNIRTLDVTQDLREAALEGDYEVAQPPGEPRLVADVLRLYVETPGEPAALSGWFMRNRTSGVREGIVGVRSNGRIVLEFLANQSAVDTVGVFSGVLSADSLVGGYVGVPGRVVFRRRR